MVVITRIHLPKSNRIHFDIKKGEPRFALFYIKTVIIYVDLLTHQLLP